MNIRRIILLPLFFISFSALLTAQEKLTTIDTTSLSEAHRLTIDIAKSINLPQLETVEMKEVVKSEEVVEEEKISKWSGGTLLQVGFSQLSLTNWASGGYDNIALNTHLNVYRNYEVLEEMYWENRLQVAYGFIHSFGDRYKKSDDKFIFDSKLAYKAVNDFYAAASFNFRSQMTGGYNYPASGDPLLISAPFAPAYLSLGIGMDYKPIKMLSINFSPLTGNLVVVTVPELRTRYGNKEDQSAKLELGAQLKLDYSHKINKNLTVNSQLTLFSDYLDKPKNIKVHWDLFVDAKLNKYFSVNIRTNLIYDDKILIADKHDNLAPRVQFKEALSVGFSYTFGEFKK